MGDLDYFKPKEKIESKKVAPNMDTTRLINAQINATNNLKKVAADVIKNPQLDILIKLLSSHLIDKNGKNKRLVINRDKKGLINTIDILEIK